MIFTPSNSLISRRSLSPLTIYNAFASNAHSMNLSSSGSRDALTFVDVSTTSSLERNRSRTPWLRWPCFPYKNSSKISLYSSTISEDAHASIVLCTTESIIRPEEPPKKNPEITTLVSMTILIRAFSSCSP